MKPASIGAVGLALVCSGCAWFDPDLPHWARDGRLLTLEEVDMMRGHPISYTSEPSYHVSEVSYDPPRRQRGRQSYETDTALRTPEPRERGEPIPLEHEPQRTAPQTRPSQPAATSPAIAPPAPPSTPPAVPEPAVTRPPPVTPLQPQPTTTTPGQTAPSPQQVQIGCFEDDVGCKSRLAVLLSDTSRSWIDQLPPPADLETGARLYAFHALRNELNCTQLKAGLIETTAVLDQLGSMAYSPGIEANRKLRIETVLQAAITIKGELAVAKSLVCMNE